MASHYFVHNIDPVLFRFGGISFYYYGLAYSLGFLGVHLWLRWRRERIGWHLEEVYEFSIIFALGLLVCGRAFEIIFYEWEYYRAHLSQLFSYWRGGMASHGVLIGGLASIYLYGLLRKKKFLFIADLVVIPSAFLLGLGRIGNFINGQIYGTLTDVWWAVKFPVVEGLRHPVTLYESAKNFLLIPILLAVRKKSRYGDGKLLAHFLFWYGFLRIFTDYFREYGAEFLGIGRGQYFNLLMAVSGIILFVWSSRGGAKKSEVTSEQDSNQRLMAEAIPDEEIWSSKTARICRRAVFAALIIFAMTIPSSWTKGVQKEYLDRQSFKKVTEPEQGEPPI
jgi:phosphatidylglycerol:prolipoprotein diacylglycerol transferase